jgi:hypothetical protein
VHRSSFLYNPPHLCSINIDYFININIIIHRVICRNRRIITSKDRRSPGAADTARDVAHKEQLMDERSVTRPSLPSTLAIVADEAFCAQAAALLGCDEEPIRDAFIGEPVEEALEMVRWALSHQEDAEGFDAAEVLAAWAKKRGRGAWSGRAPEPTSALQNLNGKLAETLIRYWSENPHELAAVLDRVEASLRRNGSS